jgi:signal transduction histidine kinase
MQKSLYWKLTLAFILVAAATAGLVAIFIRITTADRLNQFIIDQGRTSMEQSLVDYYTTAGTWEGLSQNWDQLQQGTGSGSNPGRGPQGGRGSNGRDFKGVFGLANERGVVVVASDPHFPPGTQLPSDVLKAGTPITVNNAVVGTLVTTNQLVALNPTDALFLERINQALLLAILIALVVALVIGILLARTLTLPLRALTQATQRIGRGDLEQQVKVTSQDEIGTLAAAFNSMSQEVARVNLLRKRMTADIAHDLRTPLTVIGGYIESMRDGVLQPTQERLALIYAEIERLQDMVGDLRMLSQVDAGELKLSLQRIAPKAVLDRAAALFEHKAEQQGVILTVKAAEDGLEILVDEARLQQVMDNLISNALRYTPPGGSIQLLAHPDKNRLVMSVKDTGAGIAPDELPLIFDRFYRVDSSRHSDTGESGLGLAIVKALVEAQGGRVWAESTLGEGTTIRLEFPIAI